jgi:hypothetical protein
VVESKRITNVGRNGLNWNDGPMHYMYVMYDVPYPWQLLSGRVRLQYDDGVMEDCASADKPNWILWPQLISGLYSLGQVPERDGKGRPDPRLRHDLDHQASFGCAHPQPR